MIYAQITDGRVENIIELERRNSGDFPGVVEADSETAGAVAIGDTYADRRFYRDGELVRSRREEMNAMRNSIQTVLPRLMADSVVYAAGDAAKAREIASAAAEAADLLPRREWATGMTTQPGDIVLDPDGAYAYVYSGKATMTHNNPTFFPGAAGVYHWAIISRVVGGIKVYPDIDGIIVAVRQGERWYDREAAKLYTWTGVDNAACSWYPGQAGVHQWQEVSA